ncbi:ATP-binding protein [Streptomyces sp. NPDC059477]|uniref:ATP-binding protein n=1 Tax=Streptomyces sp. NPDC059477 TaxID=3346847 RepID=UPI0036C640E0
MASPYLPHPPAQLPPSGLLRAVPTSRRAYDDPREHTRATEPPGGEFAGQLPGDPCPDRLASGDHPTAAAPHRAAERASRLSDAFALPAAPASVGAARRRVRAVLDGWQLAEETRDDAIVVTSELVTNAVTHSASEHVICRLRRTPQLLRIEVEDQNRSSARPTPRRSAPDDQSGRGLLLVAAVSADWGVDVAPDRTGRIVWAELPTTATPFPTPTPTPPSAPAPAPDGTRDVVRQHDQHRPDDSHDLRQPYEPHHRHEPHASVPDHAETTTGPSPTRPKDVRHAPTPRH